MGQRVQDSPSERWRSLGHFSRWPDVAAMNAPSLARVIPAVSWLRAYERSWLRTDIFAGITLAAYLLPAGLGDASLANLPPEAGLYACLFGGLVFWLFCSSRHTVVTVTSAISLLVGASLGLVVLYAVVANPSAPTVAVTTLVGMVVGEAIRSAAAR